MNNTSQELKSILKETVKDVNMEPLTGLSMDGQVAVIHCL